MKKFKGLALVIALLLGGACAKAQYKTEFIVDQSGNGDFESIQACIDASKAFPDTRITIYVRNGVYREKVKIHSWNTKISLIGEDREKTIITWDDHFKKIDRGRNSTFFTYTLLVQGNDFHAENLTIENSAGPVGQAVALHVEADRSTFINCRILGNQDTVYAAGENSRQYFKGCFIEGTTDFIFGSATAVFDECEIYSKSNSYITAASTPEGVAYGYVFLYCRLTAAGEVDEVFLGRPWRTHAKTVFVRCEMGDHIRPGGWDNWSNEAAEEHAFYAELQSSGPGANPAGRVSWSHQLNSDQIRNYSLKSIFGTWNVSNLNDRSADQN